MSNQVVYVNNKSTVLAYVLWFFLGQLGIHRFYLKSPIFGVFQLILGGLGWLTSFIGLGFLFLIPLWIWLLFDLFWIAFRTGHVNNEQFRKIGSRMSA